MADTRRITALFLGLIISLATAQQGVLTDGNSQLPACAQQCSLLQQAATACSGLTSASQSAWICFCQSAYLTNLPTSDTGICDSVCTNPTDSQQVSTWYKSNCGDDHGASEHADSGAASSSSSATASASSTTGALAATSSSASSGSSSSNSGSSKSSSQGGDWWSTHYKWIIMLIVLAIALPLLGILMTWLKRRHDRKQDQILGGFNAGITTRPAGGPRDAPMGNGNLNGSGGVTSPIDGSGRNSPARTRDAFMPYGYAYSRSESRLGSRQGVNEHRGSPLARGDAEKEAAAAAAQEPGKKKSRRVLVRERSGEGNDGIEMEKGPM